MSGHSKWSTIKRKKAANDSKRGKVFTKIIKEITVAAKIGGGDQDSNPRLRQAVLWAKSENMPTNNIERAIKKGTGELEGVTYEQATYEGYGPGGVAIFIEVLTDNKKRTVADVRHAITKYGGNLGESGCVSWMFAPKGLFHISKTMDEDDLMMTVLEANGDDLIDEGEIFEATCPMEEFENVKKSLEEAGAEIKHSELAMIPSNAVKVEVDFVKSLFALLDDLEDNDDVQKVYSNFDVDESVLAEMDR